MREANATSSDIVIYKQTHKMHEDSTIVARTHNILKNISQLKSNAASSRFVSEQNFCSAVSKLIPL